MKGAKSEKTEDARDERSQSRLTLALAVLVTLAALAFASGRAERTPLVWDEGDAFVRAERVSEWLFAFWRGPTKLTDALQDDRAPQGSQRHELRRYFSTLSSRRALFTPETLEVGFQHAIYREGHPSGYTLTIAMGSALAERLGIDALFSEKVALRFGMLLFFSLALGAVFWRTSMTFGRLAAFAAVVGIASCPRVFCHALIAGGDSLLISSWLLAWALFPTAQRVLWGAALWGAALALSFSAKFSGFLAPCPFFIVVFAELIFQRRARVHATARIGRLAFGLAIGLAIFFFVNPTLWNAPLHSLKTFWVLNTQRAGFNIPTYFFGEFYSLDHPLPWWNGIFWCIATVPSVLAACAVAMGVATAFPKRNEDSPRRAARDERGTLLWTAIAMALTLPTIRAMPGTPVHDGARLLIASTAFWGLLGGLGAAHVARALTQLNSRRCAFALRVALACALLAPGVADLILCAPQYLSFYSAAVGGLTGAVKRKLEPTYYWDSFDEAVATRLSNLSERARETGRPDGILFNAFSSQTLEYYRRWNVCGDARLATISNPTTLRELPDFGFYVLQRRPSAVSTLDAYVAKNAKLLFTKTTRDPLPNVVDCDRENITLLEVYDISGLNFDERR